MSGVPLATTRLVAMAALVLAVADWAGAEPLASTLPSGCELVPVEPSSEPADVDGLEPGTCYEEPGEAANHDKRLISDGPDGCTGHLPPGHTPTPLPAGLTCDKTKMTPELCAAACLAGYEAKGEEVLYIATEFAVECYCSSTTPVLPAVAPSGCSMKCSGSAGLVCGGSNFASVWKLECSVWGRNFLIALVAGIAAYAGGGTLYNQRVKGLTGRDAFPHISFWAELQGLVTDGARFAQARASGHQQSAPRAESDSRKGGRSELLLTEGSSSSDDDGLVE
jgi:hypothetical protein